MRLTRLVVGTVAGPRRAGVTSTLHSTGTGGEVCATSCLSALLIAHRSRDQQGAMPCRERLVLHVAEATIRVGLCPDEWDVLARPLHGSLLPLDELTYLNGDHDHRTNNE